ncbi:MAG TPA: NAD-dependent epimerase/dehydratase family protein, partial [Firmicutes bacterium]|nr:NAD-dependent epimerase/dehydratase family protein [Bacillota bacterium]
MTAAKKEKNSLCLVTGAAGFIGYHLAKRLLRDGHRVIGVDCFTDYYDPAIKKNNAAILLSNPNFTLRQEDLVEAADSLPDGVRWVFHQAAQAGVRASWGREFAHYTHHNILATQRLLEWARRSKPERFVYASSSSVYGAAEKLPMREDDLPRPVSPYGVSKLAAEHLCQLYYHNFDVPAVSLRYFTVYGPGQRPDMAFHRFIRAILDSREVVVYGTGEQTRDFTFVDDIVAANLAAALAKQGPGRVYNIGGGTRISINGVLQLLGELTGEKIGIRREEAQAGDPAHIKWMRRTGRVVEWPYKLVASAVRRLRPAQGASADGTGKV